MRKFLFGLLAVAAISYGLTLYAKQQQQGLTPPSKPTNSANPAKPVSSPTSTNSTTASSDGAPFVVGERLVYGVSMPGFPVAARIELEVAERGQFFGHESYQIRTKVETLGQVRSLFGDIDNQYTAYVRLNSALPHRVITSIRQGQSQSEQVVVLDHGRKQAIYADDSTTEIADETYDLTSLAYALRLHSWGAKEEGSRQKFTVLYGKELIEVEAEVKGRERLQIQAGSFSAICIKLSPKKKFSKYRVRVWLSDDERRLPIMISAHLPFGETRAELASVGVSMRQSPTIAKYDPLKDESGTPRITRTGGLSSSGSPSSSSGSSGADGNGHSAEGNSGNEGKSTNTKSDPDRSYPFVVGERLNYDIAWGNFASVGRASFEVRRQGVLGANRVFEFFGEASSSGIARSLVNVNDQMSSFAAIESLAPVRNDLRLREGKRSRQVSATYDWSKRQAVLSTGTQTEIRPGTLDLLSLFYAVRASELKVGASLNYLFLDANHRLQEVTIRVAKQETINTALGARDALQLDILAPQPAKLLLAQVWLSNDAGRLPLYLVTRTRFGELRFQLTNAVNAKQ